MPTSTQVIPQPGSRFRVGPRTLLLSIILGPQLSLVQDLGQGKNCHSALSPAGTYSLDSAQPYPVLTVVLWFPMVLETGLQSLGKVGQLLRLVKACCYSSAS